MSNQEQQFTIQPHPATTNDPNDTAKQGGGPGLTGSKVADAVNAFQTPGAHIPSASVAESLEQPKSREQLQEEFKKLNG